MKILLFARDPGGVNVVASLYHPLLDRGHCVEFFIKDYDKYVRDKFHIVPVDIMDRIEAISEDDILEFLKAEAPDFVVTGTSADDMTEKLLWRCARNLEIKTLAILDQWMNYGIRFSQYRLSELALYKANKALDCLPDRIGVMDGRAYSDMIREGHDPKRLVIVGQPYFQYIQKKYSGGGRKTTSDEKSYRILYISEPISRFYPGGELGYTEKTILAEVIAALDEALAEATPKKGMALLIRQHPQEPKDNYDIIIAAHSQAHHDFSIRLSEPGDSLALISQSDMVIGMRSMALIEAYLLKKHVISIQMGEEEENPFILDVMGLIKTVKKADELVDRLSQCLKMQQPDDLLPLAFEKSTEKIIKLLEDLI